MSICYDVQKWTMISLAMVTVTLTVGLVLVNFAHGYIDPSEYEDTNPNSVYGQEVNNNSTNSTTTKYNKIDPEFDCFTVGESEDIFNPYYGWSRCVLN